MIFYVVIYLINHITRKNTDLDWIMMGTLFLCACIVSFLMIDDNRMLYSGSAFKQA